MRLESINNIAFKANKMPKTEAKYIKERLLNSKSVTIMCHDSTDRDAANSALVMYNFLTQRGIEARIALSENYQSLDLRTNDFNKVYLSDLKGDKKPDGTVLCVDFSSKTRVTPNALDNAKEILCIDHHKGFNLTPDNYIEFNKPTDTTGIKTKTSSYIDTSAKSATSVIYRFLEALNVDIDNDTAYDLFYGFVGDSVKFGLECDGKNGTIIPSEDFKNDKNAYEIFLKLKAKLTDAQIAQIAKNIDIMSSLTPKEEEFYKYLKDNIQLSKNKKIAYVEIPVGCEIWSEVGKDNTRTSAIMQQFRIKVLNRFENVKTAIVFYEGENKYSLSMHSKEPTLINFLKYVEKTSIPNLTKNAGGHNSRCGGRIYTTDKDTCHSWAQAIVNCDDFYNT